MTEKLNRSGFLDKDVILVARGLGIILVVFGHINPNGLMGLNPYGFHMPLFFLLSGATLRLDLSTTGLVQRDAKSLLGYCLAHYLIFSTLTYAVSGLIGVSISSASPLDWRTYLYWPFTRNGHHVELFLISWFLIALFFVRILALAILKLLDRLPAKVFAPAVLLVGLIAIRVAIHLFAARYASSQLWFWNTAAQISIGLGFALFGYVLQNKLPKWSPRHPLRWAAFLYASLIYLQLSPSVISWSQYPGGTIATLLHAAIGIAGIFMIAQAFRDSTWLKLFGRDSKWIMAWHLTGFAALNLLFVSMGFVKAGDVHVLTFLETYRYWPLYLLAGIVVPLTLSLATKRRAKD